MSQTYSITVKRLLEKVFGVTTMPFHIKELANTLAIDHGYRYEGLLERLHSLGWDFELDDYTLNLIIETLEYSNLLNLEGDINSFFEQQIRPEIYH